MSEQLMAPANELLFVRRPLIDYEPWHGSLKNYLDLQLPGVVNLNVPRPFLAVVKQHVLTRRDGALTDHQHLSLDGFINALPDSQYADLDGVQVEGAFWLRRRRMNSMLTLKLADERLAAEHSAAENYLYKNGYQEDRGRNYIQMVGLGHEAIRLDQSQRERCVEMVKTYLPTTVSLGRIETLTGR